MDHSRALRASVAPCQVTGTTDQANRVTPGPGPLNPISHHSTLIWQPPIIKRRIDKPGARSLERQCPSPEETHDDDDGDDDDLL